MPIRVLLHTALTCGEHAELPEHPGVLSLMATSPSTESTQQCFSYAIMSV
ncbi:MAG: hypothetical protein RMJ55_19875 [Roseiflexaceae bacterium]|nr:hypothetical protein [Roseiflexaceae bacterium]MDW8232098.1 hypothetical protein [Roseiflexaceae bacterium]